MTVSKIKTGNSFYVDYSLTYILNGVETPLNISGITDLKVKVQSDLYKSDIEPDYTFLGNTLSIHITPEHQPYIGKYRIILSGTFNGNNISRNPIAYELVSNVEDEGNGGCGDIEIRRIEVKDSLSIQIHQSGDSGFTEDDMWSALEEEGDDQIHESHIHESIKDFITEDDLPVIPDIPTKTSQLTNDSGFITSTDLVAIKKLLFIDMWKVAAGRFGTYNTTTNKFELNGITDIEYDEALAIYEARVQAKGAFQTVFISGYNSIRTNLPIDIEVGNDEILLRAVGSYVKVINVASLSNALNLSGTWRTGNRFTPFYNCTELTTVIGILALVNVSVANSMFYIPVPKLVEIRVYGAKNGLGFFGGSPLVSLDSLKYLVENTTATGNITYLVHADVYSKLTNPSNTTWYNLNLLAISKNMQFALPV